MSWQEKIKLNFPVYFVFSLIFSLAIWSLWLPNWLGNVPNADATVLSYSTAVNVVSMVPQSSKSRIIFNGGYYSMLFTSSTATGSPTTSCGIANSGGCTIYFTSSSNGMSWSNPRVVTTTVLLEGNGGQGDEILNTFTFDSRTQRYSALFQDYYQRSLRLAYSTDGITWDTLTVVSSGGMGNTPKGNAYVAFATSSNLRAALIQKGAYIAIATTSDSDTGAGWPTSTAIMELSNHVNPQSGEYLALPLGISINGPVGSEVIHAVFVMSTTTAAGGTEIIYASSSNKGMTWTTSSVSGQMPLASAQFACFECSVDTTAIDAATGRLSVVYYKITDVSMSGSSVLTTSTVIYGQLNADNTWTTTTLARNVPITIDPVVPGGTSFSFEPTGITMLTTAMPYIAFIGTSSLPYVAVNTSTFFVEQLTTVTTSQSGEMTVAYDQELQVASVVYVNNNKIKFSTSTLAVASLNTAATSTALNPAFASDASGLVTVTTTLTDENNNTVTLYVDYSVDSGSTWASATLRTATGVAAGSLTTSSGKITSIVTGDSGEAVTFTWDTLANLGATSTGNARLRILVDDNLSTSGYRQSSNFTVDNLPPGVPSGPLFSSVTTSTLTFSWTASTGTPSLYLVSSTAASVSTTPAVSYGITGLTPNTQYTFQVKAQDAYSNTSTFSTASSTYTNADIPTSVAASSNGTTSLVVTWGSASNGTGTVYELYNVTNSSIVVTTTAVTYTVTGLTASAAYQFKVRAQYLGDSSLYSAYSSTSTSVSTDTPASSSSPSGGGGGGPSAPSVPSAAPAVSQQVVVLPLELNKPTPVTVGASSHTVTVASATNISAQFTIQSEPLKVTLKKDEVKDLDTDNDSIPDIRASYKGLVAGKPQISLANLTDENELKNSFTINAGAYETNNSKVTLTLNVPSAVQMAISNTADFAGVTFQSYVPKLTWALANGNGDKIVYVKFRSSAGGATSVSDSIRLAGQTSVTPVDNTSPIQSACSLTVGMPYMYTGTKAVYYVLPDCTRIVFENEAKYFSYFTSWSSVKKVTKDQLLKLPENSGVLPAGNLKKTYSTPQTNSTNAYVFAKDLRYGNTGDSVLALQVKLQDLGFLSKNIKANGVFGPATLKAVKKFQATNKLSQVGIVGPKTRALLNK